MIKKIGLCILMIVCSFIMIDTAVDRGVEIVSYYQEKKEILQQEEILTFKIPDWNFERLVKRGTVYKIDPYFATLLEGNQNNIIIAGHNIDTVFHDLHDLSLGMKVQLFKNEIHTDYQVTDIIIAELEEVQYLEETKQKQLTLITCTQNDQKRLIIICKTIS